MKYATLFHTVASPVASRTRQSTAAAAICAAHNAGQPILVAAACQIALQSRGTFAEPATQPTAEEVRTAIPEHGIMIHELFQLFIARLLSLDSLRAFVATFQSVAAQDPVDQLIFPRVNTSLAAQSPRNFASRLVSDASNCGEGCAARAGIMQASPVDVDAELVAIAWRKGTLRSSTLAASFTQ